MNILKSFVLTLSLSTLCIPQVEARAERNTHELIRTVQEHGIKVTFNSDRCDGTVLGSYRFIGMKRQMNLCPGSTVDPHDHSTVRHEVWHAIQHCVNTSRGTPVNSPVTKPEKLVQWVNDVVPSHTVSDVKSSYPQSQWGIEFEANAAELTFTAEEIKEIFLETCVF